MLIPHISQMDFPKTSTSTEPQTAHTTEPVICDVIFVHMWVPDLRGLVHASTTPDELACLSWPEATGSGAVPVTMAYHYVHVSDLRRVVCQRAHTVDSGYLNHKAKNKLNFSQFSSDTEACQTLLVSALVARQNSRRVTLYSFVPSAYSLLLQSFGSLRPHEWFRKLYGTSFN